MEAESLNRSALTHGLSLWLHDEFGLPLTADDGDGNHQQEKAIEDVGHYLHHATLLGYGQDQRRYQ
jgi:hypothetical protein